MRAKKITEDLCKNRKALGLVSLLSPVELMKTLVKGLDLLPKEAAKVVYDLRAKSEGLGGMSVETNKEFPVPPFMKDDEEVDESSLGPGFAGIKRHHFPPDPRSEPGDFPYDDTFVSYMNKPKRKKPLMNARERDKVPQKNPLDIDLRSTGAPGNGLPARASSSKTGDMPGTGSSWNTKGRPGWSHHLKNKEFDLPPQSIRKKDRKPVEKKMPNAGDDDTPQHLKDPNVGQNIPALGYGGATPIRLSKAGYRSYGRR